MHDHFASRRTLHSRAPQGRGGTANRLVHSVAKDATKHPSLVSRPSLSAPRRTLHSRALARMVETYRDAQHSVAKCATKH